VISFHVVEDPAAEVADRLVEAASAGGHVALSGGSTPKRAYELAAQRDIDWSAATAWFGDERCVGADDPESNYRLVNETLVQAGATAAVVTLFGVLIWWRTHGLLAVFGGYLGLG